MAQDQQRPCRPENVEAEIPWPHPRLWARTFRGPPGPPFHGLVGGVMPAEAWTPVLGGVFLGEALCGRHETAEDAQSPGCAVPPAQSAVWPFVRYSVSQILPALSRKPPRASLCRAWADRGTLGWAWSSGVWGEGWGRRVLRRKCRSLALSPPRLGSRPQRGARA